MASREASDGTLGPWRAATLVGPPEGQGRGGRPSRRPNGCPRWSAGAASLRVRGQVRRLPMRWTRVPCMTGPTLGHFGWCVGRPPVDRRHRSRKRRVFPRSRVVRRTPTSMSGEASAVRPRAARRHLPIPRRARHRTRRKAHYRPGRADPWSGRDRTRWTTYGVS